MAAAAAASFPSMSSGEYIDLESSIAVTGSLERETFHGSGVIIDLLRKVLNQFIGNNVAFTLRTFCTDH